MSPPRKPPAPPPPPYDPANRAEFAVQLKQCGEALAHAMGNLSVALQAAGNGTDWPGMLSSVSDAEKAAEKARQTSRAARDIVGPGFSEDYPKERDRALSNALINLTGTIAVDLAFIREQVKFWSEPKNVPPPCAHCGHSAKAHNHSTAVPGSECEECSCARYLTAEDLANEVADPPEPETF